MSIAAMGTTMICSHAAVCAVDCSAKTPHPRECRLCGQGLCMDPNGHPTAKCVPVTEQTKTPNHN